MANDSTPSDVVAARVRQVRTRRELTTAQLAQRCAEFGAPQLTTQALYKLEGRREGKRGARPVTVDELLALALALNVAPVHLLVPPDGDSEPYAITDAVSVPRRDARRWIRGLGLLARLPKVGDERQFFAEVPEAEFRLAPLAQRVLDGRPLRGRPVEEAD